MTNTQTHLQAARAAFYDVRAGLAGWALFLLALWALRHGGVARWAVLALCGAMPACAAWVACAADESWIQGGSNE